MAKGSKKKGGKWINGFEWIEPKKRNTQALPLAEPKPYPLFNIERVPKPYPTFKGYYPEPYPTLSLY